MRKTDGGTQGNNIASGCGPSFRGIILFPAKLMFFYGSCKFYYAVVSTYFLLRFRQISEQIFLHEEGDNSIDTSTYADQCR